MISGLIKSKDPFFLMPRRIIWYTEWGKKQFLTYYLIAAHPGCKETDMRKQKKFTREKLKTNPEQVQIFTPTPSTYSSLMHHTGLNPYKYYMTCNNLGVNHDTERAIGN